MVIMIALVILFGLVIAAMVWAPMAAEELERDQRELLAAKRQMPVNLAARRAQYAAGGSDEPQAA